MLTLINKVDMTASIPHDSIQITTVAGDPVGKAIFRVDDPGSQLSLVAQQEVTFIDEAATLGGNTLIPTHNYLPDNDFNFGAATSWSDIGSLTGRITYPAGPYPVFGPGVVATLTFSNQAVGSALSAQILTLTQLSGKNYVIPGQTYCLSGVINVTSAFTNSAAFLQIDFLDSSGALLSSTQSTHVTATGQSRLSVQATAPASTVKIRAAFGGATTSTTNSGTATFTSMQLEPVWFPNLYSYPTPICDWLQPDSITLPDGTAARLGRVFTGNITHLTVTYEGTTRHWDVEATSLDGWLENVTLINGSYSNTTDQSIITGLLNNLPSVPIFAATPGLATGTPQALAYRNVPICYAGVTVPSIQYADATMREVLNSLADMTGFLFGCDAYYNVFYYPPFYNSAPYGFAGNGADPDNVTTFGYYDYSIEYDATQLQGDINVSGSTYEVQITENFSAGDGTHSQFINGSNQTYGFYLTFTPAGSIDIPQVTFGGVAKTTILDTGAGFGTADCMIQWGNHIGIGNAINHGTSISVTYTYDALVYVQTKASDVTAQFGRRFYSKINDTNLTSNAAAVIRGEAQLAAYAQPRTTLKFKTTKMLHPTQVLNFTSALDGLSSAHFTVQQVTATYLGNGLNQYEIQAGTYVDDFVDFFRNSQKAINRADHDPNAPMQINISHYQDSLNITDFLSIHT